MKIKSPLVNIKTLIYFISKRIFTRNCTALFEDLQTLVLHCLMSETCIDIALFDANRSDIFTERKFSKGALYFSVYKQRCLILYEFSSAKQAI